MYKPRRSGWHNLPRAWPRYVPKPIERTLAVMIADGRILTEHGEYLSPQSYQELSDLVFGHNLQMWIGGVNAAMQDWWTELLADMTKEGRKERGQWTELQWSDTRGELSAVRIHRKWPDVNGKLCWQVRNLTVSSCWVRAIEPALLTDLRALFTLLETGVLPTPGQVGSATMKRVWKGTKPAEFQRHYRPPLVLIQQLEQHMIGSRREAFLPDEIFDEAYELDACNGYCAQAGELPCGYPTYYKNGQTQLWTHPRGDYFCWWGEAYVRIYDQGLAPGDIAPFAVRDEDGTLHWPTGPGLYHTWLWSWEAEEIRRRTSLGEPIECLGVGEAWAWSESTTQLAKWQKYMDAKRNEAKLISNELAKLVKLCIVAGVGALGLPYIYGMVSVEPTDGCVYLDGPDLPDQQSLYLTQEFKDVGTPKHWQAYILGRMNYRVYQEGRRCYEEGIRLAAINVDGLITGEPCYWGSHPDYVKLGEFKLKKLGTWVACPGPGMVLDPDNQRIDIPGMSWDEKMRHMELYRIGERKIPRRGDKPPLNQWARQSWSKAAHSSAKRVLEAAGYDELVAAHEAAERLRAYIRRRAP
jgi:hypothetical protein